MPIYIAEDYHHIISICHINWLNYLQLPTIKDGYDQVNFNKFQVHLNNNLEIMYNFPNFYNILISCSNWPPYQNNFPHLIIQNILLDLCKVEAHLHIFYYLCTWLLSYSNLLHINEN